VKTKEIREKSAKYGRQDYSFGTLKTYKDPNNTILDFTVYK